MNSTDMQLKNRIIQQLCKEPSTVSQLMFATGCKAESVRRALSSLIESSCVHEIGETRKYELTGLEDSA